MHAIGTVLLVLDVAVCGLGTWAALREGEYSRSKRIAGCMALALVAATF